MLKIDPILLFELESSINSQLKASISREYFSEILESIFFENSSIIWKKDQMAKTACDKAVLMALLNFLREGLATFSVFVLNTNLDSDQFISLAAANRFQLSVQQEIDQEEPSPLHSQIYEQARKNVVSYVQQQLLNYGN